MFDNDTRGTRLWVVSLLVALALVLTLRAVARMAVSTSFR